MVSDFLDGYPNGWTGRAYRSILTRVCRDLDVTSPSQAGEAALIEWREPTPNHDRIRRMKRLRTQPYRPRTNGKAERFIQTLQREWAYTIAYQTSWHRRQALTPWLTYYNRQRPHSALGHKTPASQLTTD